MKYLYILIICICCAFTSFSQSRGSDVPSLVMKGYKTNFPEATKTQWERKGHIYQAEFEVSKIEYKAHFDETGRLIVFKKAIPVSDLPSPVLRTIRKQYKGFKIGNVEKIQRDGKYLYQVELDGNPNDEKLIFTPDGKIASQETYW
ncbi:hypothetical protein DVR12_13095 [Chitinophaga silvatica]|uniref:Putative beta-lactamase-inhibitor-like PepSY-like domain-containing protein n=1 Tax=Chitinophaga silvatica TaxID=2282649 RepID=A0A3E1YAF4_9BACT|nr:PepSY-like domain-containing protein [Chitinophaga silvatica]RFS22724.1 hypothetical protein DVR12_13095 [Chitinophaga silvatica]